ncbi:HAD family hydrolase [Calditrichota bacterium]
MDIGAGIAGKLIAFDMDGTLYKSELSFYRAVDIFLERHGLPPTPHEQLRQFIGMTSQYFRAWLEELELEIPVSEIKAEFDSIERTCIVQYGGLYEGADSTLRWCRDEGWALAICSNGSEWYIETILNRFGLTGMIEHVKIPGKERHTKTQMLTDLKTVTGAETCVMVGDRHYDITGAQKAGYVSIGAAYGYGPEEIVKAEHIIQEISEVKGILSHLV